MNVQSRYSISLAMLFSAYLLQAVNLVAIRLLVDLLFISLLIMVLLDPKSPRWARVFGGTIIAISIVSSIAYGVTQYSPLGIFSFLFTAGVLALSILLVLKRLVFEDVVTLSTVLGALLAYAMFAFMCGSIFFAVDLATISPFFVEPGIEKGDYVYFSFVTLTTLGFGDITPDTDLAKRLIVLEAFIGQVFLVVLVARLVSLWGRTPHSPAVSDH